MAQLKNSLFGETIKIFIVCTCLILAFGCGGGGGTTVSDDSSGGDDTTDGSGDDGSTTEPPYSEKAGVWTGDSTFGALMINRDGEMLLPITQSDGTGKVIGVTGAMYTNVSGNTVTVYFDEDGLPTETIIGDYILRFTNWDLDAGTVDVALVFTPTGYIEIFREVFIGAAGLGFEASLKSAAANKLTCFPACETEAQNLVQLLSIGATAISLGACGVATTVSLGAAAIPCAALLLSTATFAIPEEWIGDMAIAGDVMIAVDGLGCLTLNVVDCINATLGVSSRVLGIIDEGRTNSSSTIDSAYVFLTNPSVPEGVAEAGGGLTSCGSSYECTPFAYMPCYPEGVKQCSADCSWGSCGSASCGDNICESDAGEDNSSCPEDCPNLENFMGTWSGSYNETGPGAGTCTYSNSGSMSLSIWSGGNSFSGSSSITGIHLLELPACSHYDYVPSTGSCSGSFTDTTVTGNCSYPVAITGGTFTWSFTATITGNTMNGTFTGDSQPGSGFTLTK